MLLAFKEKEDEKEERRRGKRKITMTSGITSFKEKSQRSKGPPKRASGPAPVIVHKP